MKKILILGANGGIGRNLVDYFYERKTENGLELLTADLEYHQKFVQTVIC